MKKISLLLVMLLVLVAPSAIAQQKHVSFKNMTERPVINLDGLQVRNMPANANRDALTLTVNNGTTTNSNLPIPGNYVANLVETQFVIPAASLTSMVPEGYYAKISGLSFAAAASTSNVSWGDATFLVLMQEINYDPANPGFWYDENAMTYLYYGALSISNGTMSFEFNLADDGFDYFGGDLLICFYEYTTGSSATSTWYGVNASNPYAVYWNGANSFLSAFCPKTTFTYTQEAGSCVVPAGLVIDNITKTSADLSWTERGQSESWQVSYNTEDNPDGGIIVDVTGNPSYSFDGLDEGTVYYVYVRAMCDGNTPTDWSDGIYFRTPATCDQPLGFEVSNVTTNSAKLDWTGYDDNYDIRYRVYVEHDIDDFLNNQVGNDVTTTSDFTNYTFDLSAFSGNGYIAIRHYNVTDKFWLDVASVIVKDANGNTVFTGDLTDGWPDDWHMIDYDGDGFNWSAESGFVYSESYSNTYGALEPDNWLITPIVRLGGSVIVNAKGQDANYANEVFGVYVSSVVIDEYEWNMVENVSGTNYTINNLEMGTLYAAQVKAHSCSDAKWCDFVTFTTPSNMFIKDGDWNTPQCWSTEEVPDNGSDVLIQANCVIPTGYVANAGNVTIQEGGSLTIKDGGQLIHTNTGVVATVEKEISGYTGDKDNYYLISSPVTHYLYQDYLSLTFPDEVTNLLGDDYDFYQFDCTEDLEWLNYKAESFYYMIGGLGYLYANSNDVTLSFTGELLPFQSTYANGYDFLSYESSDENFRGFNLVGNMLAANAYIVIADYDEGITGLSEDVYFYTMGDGELVAGTGAVAPMEAVMVQASAESQVALCFTQPLRSNSALNINLSDASGMIDAAYIRFNEGSELNKFQLNPNHTKLFFTKDNKDYAVVYSDAQNEMPVSFKAEKNGTYTISFSNENVEFGYLHLIDNMTGNDVDLLQTPSYTFTAKTTDYASRFRLVFSADSANDDIFAYYNNGSFVINNEGNATLQVIDMMGRTISTETINGNANIHVNAANGVYMLRLINGDSVKVQKVVVK